MGPLSRHNNSSKPPRLSSEGRTRMMKLIYNVCFNIAFHVSLLFFFCIFCNLLYFRPKKRNGSSGLNIHLKSLVFALGRSRISVGKSKLKKKIQSVFYFLLKKTLKTNYNCTLKQLKKLFVLYVALLGHVSK